MALSFDGVDDYVDHGSAASLDMTADITVALWFYSAAGDATGRRLVSKRTTPGTNNLEIVIADYDGANTIECTLGHSTSEQYAGEGSAYATNTWQLGIFTFPAGDQARMYFGTLTAPPSEPVAYGYAAAGSGTVGSTAGTALWVGRRPGIASISGRIARVGYWGRVLNATERQALWTQTAAEWAALSNARLVCAYGGTGSQTDLSGNGNHGTISGATDIADPIFPTLNRAKYLPLLGVA